LAKITLREITKVNWRECARLRVAEDQVEFVTGNAYSLAQSRYEPNCLPFGIYADGVIVGFVMYGLNEYDGRYWIFRFMIDERYQGKGYGKTALAEVIHRLRDDHDAREVRLSCNPANAPALRIYERAGFTRTGEMLGKEIVMRLKLA